MSDNKLPSIPQRRRELKDERRALQHRLDDALEEMKLIEARVWNDYPFTKSNEKGRTSEYTLFLAGQETSADGALNELAARHRELKAIARANKHQIDEIDDQVSAMNFHQKERSIIASRKFDEAVDKLGKLEESIAQLDGAVSAFSNSIDRYIQAKGQSGPKRTHTGAS